MIPLLWNYVPHLPWREREGERKHQPPHLSSQQVDDLEGVLDDAHRHQLLAVVASVHHHVVGETLNDGALGIAEALGGVAPHRVREVLGVLLFHCNVILEDMKTVSSTREYI